ncbi:MAG: hypothetical protein GXP55_00090, partial [Deltaproteobacteria bacterium]|nr:hypothetical protein [Deltaproteobacteria bacterium]
MYSRPAILGLTLVVASCVADSGVGPAPASHTRAAGAETPHRTQPLTPPEVHAPPEADAPPSYQPPAADAVELRA